MIFLSIDTSTCYSVVAISSATALRAGARRLFQKGRTDRLAGLIDLCLKKAKCRLKDIDGFGVGVGPGSFTGLRIGLSAIKGLSYALKKPCYAYSSLDAIAYSAKDRMAAEGVLCVMVDARRSNVYGRFYRVEEGARRGARTVQRLSDDLLLPVASFLSKMPEGSEVCGDAARTYAREIEGRGQGACLLPEKFWFPSPKGIALLTQEGFRAGQSLDPFKVNAVYLYQEDCQVSPLRKA